MGIDARIMVEGTAYEIDPDLAGETVLLLWGCLITSCMLNLMVSELAHITLSQARSH